MKKALVFHHSDLDGMGVKIVGTMAANRLGYTEVETFKCNYSDVNDIVMKRLQEDLSDVGLVIIADISVNIDVAEFIDNEIYGNCGINVVLRDHHATAEALNQYNWAEVHEKVDGVPRCGTWQLAKAFPEQITDMDVFVETIDDWDTWKWVENGNEYAKELNSLLQVVGEDKFTECMTTGAIPRCCQVKPEYLFDDWAKSMIEAHQMFIEKTAKSCASNMWTTTMKVDNQEYLTGIVFCNQDISDVANNILEHHPELDILMLVGFPRNISFRTRKKLAIPLGKIAELMTGSGGGHPQSAGSVISKEQFTAAFTYFLHNTSRGKLYFNPLELPKED